MRKCYFFVVAALFAFSPLAFSMENTDDSFEGEEIAAAEIDNEGYFGSDFISGAQNVVNGCVGVIDSVVGTPADVVNNCCDVINGCVGIIDSVVGTPSDVVNNCLRNPGLVVFGVTMVKLVGPAEAANCTGCYCNCRCMRPDSIVETVGKATDIGMCSQVCNSIGNKFTTCI